MESTHPISSILKYRLDPQTDNDPPLVNVNNTVADSSFHPINVNNLSQITSDRPPPSACSGKYTCDVY